jgi:hypothetical protein
MIAPLSLISVNKFLFTYPSEKTNMKNSISLVRPVMIKAAAALTLLTTALASAQSKNSILPLLPPSVSTVPSNGDVNPYGVVFVPRTVPEDGILQRGDILVSNFNNSQNLQGLGTTILRVDRSGKTSTFFTGPAQQSGLTAALGILSDGIVMIGNLPTIDGTAATVQPGRLSFLDRNGNFLGALNTTDVINGPWGMAVYDDGNGFFGTARVFLSNVLSGVISRIDVQYSPTEVKVATMVLASGFNHRLDPAAIVLGPSGLVFDAKHDTLFIASSADNAIYEIQNAAAAQNTVSATLFFQDLTHLHGPLDIALLPNGHLIVANSDGSNADPNQPSELVEYNREGQFLAQMPVDPNNGGAFGLAVKTIGENAIRLAAVDDNANTLNIWTTVIP